MGFSRTRNSLSFGDAFDGILMVLYWSFMMQVVRGGPEMKNGTVNPIPTFSPSQGSHMTSIEGASWCMAQPGVSQIDLQDALEWACGSGMADCSPFSPGQPCFLPNSLLAHASYAFNSYYQQNGKLPAACHFGGTAAITTTDPSCGSCIFPTAGGKPSSSMQLLANPKSLLMQILGILLFFYIQ